MLEQSRVNIIMITAAILSGSKSTELLNFLVTFYGRQLFIGIFSSSLKTKIGKTRIYVNMWLWVIKHTNYRPTFYQENWAWNHIWLEATNNKFVLLMFKMTENVKRKVFIWSTPRSISTAFMRCFMNMGTTCKVS